MKIAITGEKGFLGYHLTQYFKWISKDEFLEWGFSDHTIVKLGKDYLNNIHLVEECDLLIHCAGVNRGDNVYEKNIELTSKLVESLTQKNISINIKFPSSIQEDYGNEYGNSKIKCKEILENYCKSNNTIFESYKIPNIYGPFGKPNYNSFVNTFCYNLSKGISSNYNHNEVELCYVYDVAKVIDNKIPNFPIVKTTVKEVYDLLNSFHDDYYQKGTIPTLLNEFHRNLFNVYRGFISSLFQFESHSDNRGCLVELVKGKGSQTQIFYSTTKPGITRGEHFHFNKLERFCVLKGKAKISMRKIGEEKVNSYIITGDDNKVIDMPILHTHDITNIGKEDLICTFWVNEIYDKDAPDTYYEKVLI
jgi:UDP-2-acetamido-2,6-beta-L-arabino-hexul-4-ose reductase